MRRTCGYAEEQGGIGCASIAAKHAIFYQGTTGAQSQNQSQAEQRGPPGSPKTHRLWGGHPTAYSISYKNFRRKFFWRPLRSAAVLFIAEMERLDEALEEDLVEVALAPFHGDQEEFVADHKSLASEVARLALNEKIQCGEAEKGADS